MTYYLIIALCIIILISYFFEVTARFTRIPGVILMILLGMAMNYGLKYLHITIPDLAGLLPVMGTIGLILIVLEGSLDLTLQASKKKLILASVSSGLVLFLLFIGLAAFILVRFMDYPLQQALINLIPLGIISSAVAIPSAVGLHKNDREFVVYESSVSDIVGILAFNFLITGIGEIGRGLLGLTGEILITIVFSVLFSAGLALLLHKITHHVKHVIITTAIIAVYALAHLKHMPSLLMVLIFGLVLNNNHLFRNKYTARYLNFESFSNDLSSFKQITGELTFVIRSFFFIMFGYYTSLTDLIDLQSLLIAVILTFVLILIRAMYLTIVLSKPLNPLLFFVPRGLITILLFLGIPAAQLLPYMTRGLITQVIFLSILWMSFGNILLGFKKKVVPV